MDNDSIDMNKTRWRCLPGTAEGVVQTVITSPWVYITAGSSVLSATAEVAVDAANVPARRSAVRRWTIHVAMATVDN